MSKIKKILIGTHNQGKYREISHLLPKTIKKINPKSIKIKPPKETGKTFLANAIHKANYFTKKTGMITISDDSGLEVKALKYKPGIYSARWAKRMGGFTKAMSKILKLIKKKKDRKAYFVCALCVSFPNGKIVSSVQRLKGKISFKIKGKKGFGYDSIFIPHKKKNTFGQMNRSNKMKIDHRYLAFRKLIKKTNIF